MGSSCREQVAIIILPIRLRAALILVKAGGGAVQDGFQTPTFTYPDGPAIGTIGERVAATAAFDGWDYVHLLSNPQVGGKFAELDTYAIPEVHDPACATGFGDLNVRSGNRPDGRESRPSFLLLRGPARSAGHGH
jgi:hypothetical protein